MSDEMEAWSETDSDIYRELAPAAVPRRADQLATLATLLPFTEEQFHFVDLGSGEGALSATILDCHPGARVTALDGSESMRAATARRLQAWGDRFEIGPFDLRGEDWVTHLEDCDAVVSSLVIHHIDGNGKRRLYADIARLLSDRGVLLIADLVAPATRPAHELFATTWDEAARYESRLRGEGDRLYDLFVNTRWNIYRHPDPMDMPSPLADQLRWLGEAGFAVVDCFWLQAAHAIYGGYKAADPAPGVTYATARASAERALEIS